LSPTPFLVYLAEGELALAKQDYARAITLMDRLVTGLRALGIRPFIPDALYLKGRAYMAEGRLDEADMVLAEARAEADVLGGHGTLWQILIALYEAETRRGNQAEAQTLRQEARLAVEFIADHVGSPGLRASFLNLPQVRAVLDPDL
jgi:tetratricopeptide (TPR) repeat protein